jgi:hypothetical protein
MNYYTIDHSLLDVLKAPCGPMPHDASPTASFSRADRAPWDFADWSLNDFDVRQGLGGDAPIPDTFHQVVKDTKIRDAGAAVDRLTYLLPQAPADPRNSAVYKDYKYYSRHLASKVFEGERQLYAPLEEVHLRPLSLIAWVAAKKHVLGLSSQVCLFCSPNAKIQVSTQNTTSGGGREDLAWQIFEGVSRAKKGVLEVKKKKRKRACLRSSATRRQWMRLQLCPWRRGRRRFMHMGGQTPNAG